MTAFADTGDQFDWGFHQATGMVLAQMEIQDPTEGAARLIAASAAINESVRETARLVLDRQLRLYPSGAVTLASENQLERAQSAD